MVGRGSIRGSRITAISGLFLGSPALEAPGIHPLKSEQSRKPARKAVSFREMQIVAI
jgi:hypothetical protein